MPPSPVRWITLLRPSPRKPTSDVLRDGALLASVSIEIVAMHTSTRELVKHQDAFLEGLRPYLDPTPVAGPRRAAG